MKTGTVFMLEEFQLSEENNFSLVTEEKHLIFRHIEQFFLFLGVLIIQTYRTICILRSLTKHVIRMYHLLLRGLQLLVMAMLLVIPN